MFQEFTHSGFSSRVWSATQEPTSSELSQDVVLRAYGRVQCNGRFHLEQVHGLFAFHIFEQGSGTFILDGTRYPISAGQMVVVWPGVHVRYFDTPESPWRYRWFSLTGSGVADAITTAGLKQQEPVIDSVGIQGLSDIFSRIESVYSTDPASPLLSVAFAYEVLGKFAELVQFPAQEYPSSVVDRATFIIQQDYHQALQVEDIARRLGISRATLFRRFRKELGVSPKVYLDEFRLNQAHELVKRGHSTVKSIAYACGYQCPHYFSNAYKRRFGTAPSHRIKQ